MRAAGKSPIRRRGGSLGDVRVLMLALAATVGCYHAGAAPTTTPTTTPTPVEKVRLLTLPVESDVFPQIAKAATEALAHAQVSGIDEATTSKVSIEVVQLSIECVDPTATCYDAAARSLSANKLLFAQVEVEGKKPRVSVTLFDRAAKSPKTAMHTYATVAAAISGIEALVAEATR